MGPCRGSSEVSRLAYGGEPAVRYRDGEQAPANRWRELPQQQTQRSGTYVASQTHGRARGWTPAAPVAAPVVLPRASPFEFVTCSTEVAGQLCSTPGCNRPRRHHRINVDSFTSEPVCCPSCSAPPTGLTSVAEHVHSEACNLREADRTRRRSPAPSPTHVSRHATSVARVNDGSAGGSARSHNDD